MIKAVQGIPLERNAWHCGDGGGNGNRKSIGVEICYSLSGGDRYYKAEDNANYRRSTTNETVQYSN